MRRQGRVFGRGLRVRPPRKCRARLRFARDRLLGRCHVVRFRRLARISSGRIRTERPRTGLWLTSGFLLRLSWRKLSPRRGQCSRRSRARLRPARQRLGLRFRVRGLRFEWLRHGTSDGSAERSVRGVLDQAARFGTLGMRYFDEPSERRSAGLCRLHDARTLTKVLQSRPAKP